MSDIPKMRFLVFGCGGVGGYFGARLAEQGQEVSFMARNQALAALKKHGVRIKSICGDLTVPPEKLGALIDTTSIGAQTQVCGEAPLKKQKAGEADQVFEADVIILGCKAWEAERCLSMCRPWCGPKTLVLPLQNGVEGFDKIKNIVSSWGVGRALAGCCNIVSAIQEPGMIRHWAANPPYITFGEFEGAPCQRTRDLQKIFAACPGMAGHLEEEAMPNIWEKFAFICSTTAVGAVSGPSATQDIIAATPELLALWRTCMMEIITLARSYGLRYEDEWLEKRVGMLQAAVGATTSCSRDLWAGKPSEVDDLLGSVVRMGKEQKIPTPSIATLFSVLITRERLAREEIELPIYPLAEGQKIFGAICNHKGQQLPADRMLEQKKADDFKHVEWAISPMSSAILSGGNVICPEGVSMGWEVELGVIIKKSCAQVPAEKAMDVVGGYCMVLDMTGFSTGFEIMKHGFSWTRNKALATWKPVGPFIKPSAIKDPMDLTIITKVNDKEVARDSTKTLKFNIAEQIADASSITPLQRGDILMVGAGSLGPVSIGDIVEGYIEGLDSKFAVRSKVVAAKSSSL
mmetsp:Transcript_5901/g.13739  ORF Transcript_5901/g.13739 Transcript_5901/m.13739 type:complete len:575 (+) Transcript_5901:130-1854(+)|eukprot:CAMPEP_0206445044 /NCGR_PEP_ID=MMETSP0324_2-20121206/15263_1 /ASSEMBLY_ACC=CAM_ASM_000836 /TAXON_ID=2866 /ORGANISM="Crypthecodinium cohnii, Strain Seligo" /LENGTH=574 /DNA_ID=CAMNT_0053913163 /DNA_START=113 /DNA_END=1837 /DNA_ORIENTATION=+